MKRKKKSENTVIWVVGGVIAAFGAYEVFIKPKAVATAVPISSTATVTQAKLPAPVNPVTQVTSLAQTVAKMLNPAPASAAPVSDIVPSSTTADSVSTLPPSNYYLNAPLNQPVLQQPISPLYTPASLPLNADYGDKQAYDSMMYANYEASLSGCYPNFEV